MKTRTGLHFNQMATVSQFKAISGWIMAQIMIDQPISHKTYSIHSSRWRWVTLMVMDPAHTKLYSQHNQQTVPNNMQCWNPSSVTPKRCQLNNLLQYTQCHKQCNHQQQMATKLNKTRQVCSTVDHEERNPPRKLAKWVVEVAISNCNCSKPKALYSNISRLSQLQLELTQIDLWQANCTQRISQQ